MRVDLHIAVQPPPVLIGDLNDTAASQLMRLESCLRGDTEQGAILDWQKTTQWPVTLSDASAPMWGLEQHVSAGLRGVVWFGTGYGWEERGSHLMPSLERLADIIRASDCLPPKIVVVCLKYGAKAAAEALQAAGVETVMWLQLEHVDESAFVRIIAPALQAFNDGRAADIYKALNTSATTGTAASVYGCHTSQKLEKWVAPKLKSEWLSNLALDRLPETNLRTPLGKSLRNLQVLACDLKHLQKLYHRLESENIMVVSNGIEGADARRRALALGVCLSCIRENSYAHVYRISSVRDMATACEKLSGTSILLWFDFASKFSLEDVESIKGLFCSSDLDLHATAIITCVDDCGAATPENLEELAYDEHDIKDESGISNVYADQLHDEFKLMASWTSRSAQRSSKPETSEQPQLEIEPEPEAGIVSDGKQDQHSYCLLDVFAEEDLVEALRQQLDNRPLVAVYRTNDNGIMVRVCVSDVGFLHEMRDRLLQGTLCRDLEEGLVGKPRKDGFEELDLILSVDKSQFAERYEDAILNLNQLTPHQREKLAECRDALDAQGRLAVHIRAPAGAGKTFVALHFMQSVLADKSKSDRDETPRVLFIARNPPLTIFVAKWLAQRCKVAPVRKRLLSRLHVVSDPLSSGPRLVKVVDGAIVTDPIAASGWGRAELMKYDLVVIDEAHHLFRDEASRQLVEPFVQASERCMLLSDVSQSLREDIQYPDTGWQVVMLTEVVRSSKRIIAAALQFQLTGPEDEGQPQGCSRCAHKSDGPPLKSFLFDVPPETDRYDAYALHTVRAVRQIVDDFEELCLHDRLAVICPDRAFVEQLHPILDQKLASEFSTRRFKLVTAAEAAAACVSKNGSEEGSSPEWIVVDEIEQMDGLERLICLCTGLDAVIDDQNPDTLETRSLLYRAMTRAHMMVVVVNEFLAGGWFEFLTQVRLRSDAKFDADQVQQEARSADETIRKAKQQLQAYEASAEAFLSDPAQSNLSGDAKSFMFRYIVDRLQGGQAIEQATEQAKLQWDREVIANDELARWPDADATQRRFLRKAILTELERDGELSAAVQSAERQWQRRVTVPTLVKAACTRGGIHKTAHHAAIAESANDDLGDAAASEETIQHSIAAAIQDWLGVGRALDEACLAQGLLLSDVSEDDRCAMMSDIKRLVAQGTTGLFGCKQACTPPAVAIQRVKEWAGLELLKRRTHSINLRPGVLQSMVATVSEAIGSGITSAIAVENAMEEWQRVEAAVRDEARKRNISEADQDGFQFLPELLARCRTQKAGLDKLVVEILVAWQEQQSLMERQQKKEQSIWDASHNVLSRPPSARARSPRATLSPLKLPLWPNRGVCNFTRVSDDRSMSIILDPPICVAERHGKITALCDHRGKGIMQQGSGVHYLEFRLIQVSSAGVELGVCKESLANSAKLPGSITDETTAYAYCTSNGLCRTGGRNRETESPMQAATNEDVIGLLLDMRGESSSLSVYKQDRTSLGAAKNHTEPRAQLLGTVDCLAGPLCWFVTTNAQMDMVHISGAFLFERDAAVFR